MPDLAHIVVGVVSACIAYGLACCIIPPRVAEREKIATGPLPVYWPEGTVGLRPYNQEHRAGVPVGTI